MHKLVVHCKKSNYDIYIGRPTEWGNPFSLRDHTRKEAIEKYKTWLETSPEAKNLRDNIYTLRGKILGCWCSPLDCHGDVLAELANK